MELQQIETVVQREVLTHILQVERIELGLRFAEGDFHFAGLQHLIRVIGTDTECQSAVHDILAQAERQTHRTLLGLFIADGIIVERTGHSRNGRIEAVAILRSHHFLNDDGHFLLVDDIAGGLHVCLAVAIEYRSIDSLDSVAQHTEHFVLVLQIGNHVGGVDTGKGLVM